ncbi:MAG TPA: hypothetical protein VM364_01915 [Vicinamibacterales bacterium]|nr:hypothetical protein [Vicinamibacterales bacterium]
MRHHLLKTVFVWTLCASLAGCSLFDRFKDDKEEGGTPTSPGTAVSLETFAGTWTSSTASTPATGCGNLTYTVTPVGTNAANVVFAGTCAGSINVSGNGTGKISGSTLQWSAQGLVGQGGVNCPFSFTNGKATKEADGSIKVTYSGTVCGIPVSGTEVVKK